MGLETPIFPCWIKIRRLASRRYWWTLVATISVCPFPLNINSLQPILLQNPGEQGSSFMSTHVTVQEKFNFNLILGLITSKSTGSLGRGMYKVNEMAPRPPAEDQLLQVVPSQNRSSCYSYPGVCHLTWIFFYRRYELLLDGPNGAKQLFDIKELTQAWDPRRETGGGHLAHLWLPKPCPKGIPLGKKLYHAWASERESLKREQAHTLWPSLRYDRQQEWSSIWTIWYCRR